MGDSLPDSKISTPVLKQRDKCAIKSEYCELLKHFIDVSIFVMLHYIKSYSSKKQINI